jgi:TolB protein
VIDIESGHVTGITSEPGENRDPAWSPDGGSIVYTKTSGDETDLYVYSIGENSHRRLTHSSTPESEPVYSPSGDMIAYVSSIDGDAEIFEMASDGSAQHVVARLPDQQASPTYSTFDDGSAALWFASHEGGRWRVYYMLGRASPIAALESDGQVRWITFARQSH